MASGREILSKESEQILIDGVRDRPCLWDKTHDKYKNTNSRESAWTELGTLMGMNVHAAKKIWESLRGQFSKFRKKLQFPSGGPGGRRPCFRHEDAMRFLLETIEPDEETYSNAENSSSNADGNDSQEFSLGILNQYESQDNDVPINDSSIPASFPRAHDQPIGRSHSLFQGKRKLDQFDENLLMCIGARRNEDEYDEIGRVYSKRLREIGNHDRSTYLTSEIELSTKINDTRKSQL